MKRLSGAEWSKSPETLIDQHLTIIDPMYWVIDPVAMVTGIYLLFLNLVD